jgi:hypothetical protein
MIAEPDEQVLVAWIVKVEVETTTVAEPVKVLPPETPVRTGELFQQ